MPYIYIIKSKKSDKYYTGCSNNIDTRINMHNCGRVVSTKADRPWELIYFETYSNLKEARRREKQIKRWKSRVAIERIFKNKILQNRGSSTSPLVEVGKGTAKNMGIEVE